MKESEHTPTSTVNDALDRIERKLDSLINEQSSKPLIITEEMLDKWIVDSNRALDRGEI